MGIVVAVLLAGLLVVAATPAVTADHTEMDQEFEITIEDEDSASGEMTLFLEDELYYELHTVTSEEGYDSVAEWFAAALATDDPAYVGYGDTADTRTAEGYAVEMSFPQIVPGDGENTEIDVEDDELSLLMGDIDDPSQDPELGDVTYEIEMPGPITTSNAYEEDGSVATWKLHEEPVSVVSVDSMFEAADDPDQTDTEESVDDSTDNGAGADETADDTDQTDAEESTDDSADDGTATDDAIPGFGIVAAIASLLAAIALRRE